MAQSNITIAVGGFSEFADVLNEAGYFKTVISMDSMAALRDHARTTFRGLNPSQLILCISDRFKEDTNQPLGTFLGKLSKAGFKVLLIQTSSKASELLAQAPDVAVAPLPVSANDILGAFSAIEVPGLSPIAAPLGTRQLDVGVSKPKPVAPQVPTRPTTPPQAPAFKPPVPPMFAPKAPRAPEAPSTPTPAPEPPKPAPQAPPAFETPPAFSAPAAPKAPEPEAPSVPAAPPAQGAPPAFTPPPAFSPPPPAPKAPEPEPFQAPPPEAFTMPLVETPPATNAFSRPPSVTPGNFSLGARQGSDYPVNYQAPKRMGKIVVIFSRKGGVGKTSLSTNLAVHTAMRLKESGKNVALVDINMGNADVGKLFTVPLDKTMYNLTGTPVLTPQVVSNAMHHIQDLNLSLLLGPTKVNETNPLFFKPEFFHDVLTQLRQIYDYIFVDTEVAQRYLPIFNNCLLPLADRLLVVVTPDKNTLLNNHELLETLALPHVNGGQDLDPSKVRIVFNAVEDGVGIESEDMMSFMSKWKAAGQIPRTKEWMAANNEVRLVATQGLADLNQHFSEIAFNLFADPDLMPPEAPKQVQKGLFSKLFKRS